MYALFLGVAVPAFLILSISFFRTLPRIIRNLFSYYTFLGFALNLALSSLILVFTGSAMVAGISNLAASVLFGLYLLLYREAHKLKACRVVKKPALRGIISLPTLSFQEDRPRLTGLLRFIFGD